VQPWTGLCDAEELETVVDEAFFPLRSDSECLGDDEVEVSEQACDDI